LELNSYWLANFFNQLVSTSPSAINRAYQLLSTEKTSLSFFKGSWPKPYIISGITTENNTTFTSKVNAKESEFTWSCSCKHWLPDSACQHILAVMYQFYYQELLAGKIQNAQSASMQYASLTEPGSIIRHPQQFNSTWNHKNFSELNYKMASGEVCTYPSILNSWNADWILDIELIPEPSASSQENYQRLLKPKFSITRDNHTYSKINFMNKHAVVFWETGEICQIPTWTAAIIDGYIKQQILRNENDHLDYLTPYLVNPLTLTSNGHKVSLSQSLDGQIEIHFQEKDLRKQIFLKLVGKAQQGIVALPEVLKLFAEKSWDQRNLINISHVFSKLLSKNPEGDYEFLPAEDSLPLLMDMPLRENKLELIQKLVEQLFYQQELLSISNGVLVKWDTAYLRTVLLTLINRFGIDLVALPSWDFHHSSLFFELPLRHVSLQLKTLYHDLLKLNVNLLWDKQPVQLWKASSSIRRVSSNIDWFEFQAQLSSADIRILSQIGSSPTQLIDGKMILIDDEQRILAHLLKKNLPTNLNAADEHVVQIKIAKNRIIEIFHLRHLGLNDLLTPQEIDLCERLLNLKEIPLYNIDPRYDEILRPYQVTGSRWMRFLFEHQMGGCLADDMGLGKTVQAISLMQSIYKKGMKFLIVCPVSILWNWQQELAKFSDLPVTLYYGFNRQLPPETEGVILTSYGLIKRDYEKTFSHYTFDLLMLDEVQQIKNSQSLGSKVVKQIKSKVRFSLTGTPVENDISEFQNIIDLCVPGLWGEHSLRKYQENELKDVAKIMAKPFILRRTKSQVLSELPEKTEQVQYLTFSDTEQRNYEATLVNVRNEVEQNIKNKSYGLVLKHLLLMRQMCLKQEINGEMFSSKVQFLKENVEQLMKENHAVLIFSQFTTYLDYIQKALQDVGGGISRIDGSQSMKQRQQEVHNFQNGENKIFLISLRAGGFGLNLTKANYIFLMDPWWNPAVESQAIDRAHRIGQLNKLTVYRPIIRGSIEEKVLVLQQEKRKLFDDLMSSHNDEYFSGKLSADDFKFLLS
jgi:superfamily II DNA or RNA helicase